MTKKIGKERDNGEQKESITFPPPLLPPSLWWGTGSEWETDRTEYRAKVVFALLNWFCLVCKLVAVESNEACGYVLCDLHLLLKLFGISCQYLNIRISFKIWISGIS